jgi:hypothetical protein
VIFKQSQLLDIDKWHAWAPSANELQVQLRHLADKCIMVKKPMVDHHAQELFADAVKADRSDLAEGHQAFVNTTKEKFVYILIVLPENLGSIYKDGFSPDGDETGYDTTVTLLKKDVHQYSKHMHEQVVNISWYFALGRGKDVAQKKATKSSKLK